MERERTAAHLSDEIHSHALPGLGISVMGTSWTFSFAGFDAILMKQLAGGSFFSFFFKN